jgi:hypothetical protein
MAGHQSFFFLVTNSSIVSLKPITMPTWHDLPREIHDHILRMFCLDITDM